MTERSPDSRPLVSVIVPIFNAEKFLGYCLNSLVRQTYTNWQAILIDDGSTDRSREIAHRFARLDSRFRVISIPNGGVSHARNVGLEYAEGAFLHFLDSDDVLAAETLERQVAAANRYGKQLIVSDVLITDFTAPQRHGPRLSAKWLDEKPAVLDREEFRQKRMRLIWHTALLEGLYGKLYERDLWERLQLRFPEELSLGEDLVTNLRYYDACNGVVFLQQIGHYYNNISDSDSLTHKYRPDLFEAKMYLMEQLWAQLTAHGTISQEELRCFHNYVAGTGLLCVNEVIGLRHSLTLSQKRKRLTAICSHRQFVSSLANAEHLPQSYAHYADDIQRGRIRHMLRMYAPKKHATSLPNRALRKIIRTMRPAAGRFGPSLDRLEASLARHGIRYTLSAYGQGRREKP